MEKQYYSLYMSFDGSTKKEGPFNTIEKAWQNSADSGSRWYFYPFHFVSTEKTIKDTGHPFLQFCENLRIKTVAKIFKIHSEKPDTESMDYDNFIFTMQLNN